MMNKNIDSLLAQIDGKTEEEIREILKRDYKISWDDNTPCKNWYAKVFTYCKVDDLQEELNFFLWLINFFAPIFHFCFQEEDTVFLGCICPCSKKQTILYYTLTRNC